MAAGARGVFAALALALVAAGCGRRAEPPPIEPLHESPATSPTKGAGVATAPKSIEGDRSELAASIEIAITMLDRKDYRAFLSEFVSPEDRARFDKKGGIDAILPDFAKDKAAELLELLRKLRGVTPKREDNAAVFALPGEKSLTWVNDDGKWYIKN